MSRTRTSAIRAKLSESEVILSQANIKIVESAIALFHNVKILQTDRGKTIASVP